VVDGWEKRLDPFGIALGTWTAMIRSVSKAMAGRPGDPLAKALRLSADAVVGGLEAYTPTRNVYAHGGKPRLRLDQQAAVSELEVGVSAILDGMEPLTHVQFGLIRSCQPSGTSYTAEFDQLTGPAEPFPARRLRCPLPLEPGTVVVSQRGSLESAVDLMPFCVWRPCPVCHRDELFYLHRRRKQRSSYFSFSTGHERTVKKEVAVPAPRHAAALRMEPRGSVRSAAASGWRATWADLASRPRRIAARLADLGLAATVAAAGGLLAAVAGAAPLVVTLTAALLAVMYEPLIALTGGTPGKRLLRIERISIWDGRALGRADRLRRALFADAQILFPPLAVRNLAWVLWDPARQCLHDRKAASIVIAGRTRPGQKT
jgi:RDD family